MGCKTTTGICNNFVLNTNHCFTNRPGEGVSLEFKETPAALIRTGNYNIPDRDGNAVMYSSIALTDPVGASAANCGKVSVASPCAGFLGTSTLFFDYYPSELSFDYILSDTWFSYLYDTSDDAGVAGTPCFYIETRTSTTTTSTTTTDPQTQQPSTSESSSTETTTTCIPCTAFNCTAAETNLSYTADEDLTGDPDCPHPTLFAFGTNSNKIAFSYNQLSTEVPDGVTDFSVSYDGVTYVDVWDEGNLEGISYDSTQNPWQSGDEEFADFEVFEIENSPTSTGLRIKFYIQPIFDDTGASVVFSGTRWTVSELLSPGTGYSVNDVFALEYLHTHPDNSQTTLTLNFKVTATGPVPITEGQEGFDLLRIGDTINGHIITRTFHTDIDNFPYHVAYVDGDGSNFAKDTQYTSDRDHIITVKAGYGIPDRAIAIGLYEFLNKSVQYVTASLDKNAPEIFGVLNQPDIAVTVTNGRVSGVSIVDGGSNWDQLGKPPELLVGPPEVASGTNAVVEGTFSGGVLTNISIKEPGSGYDDNNPPSILVRNIFKLDTSTFSNDNYRPDLASDFKSNVDAIPKGDLPISSDIAPAIDTAQAAIPREIVNNDPNIGFDVKKDPERNRITVLPQSMYSKAATDPIRPKFLPRYDLRHLEDAPLDDNIKRVVYNERERFAEDGSKIIDSITQDVIPEFKTEKEVLINTVQGSLKGLPKASRYTKYLLRQYRADPRTSININFTLSCSPVETGCSHFSCPPPAATPGSTITDPTETDPITGDTTDSSTTNTYTVSALLGDGCKDWSASGSMKIFNNLTGAGQNVLRAVEAFGNPYDD